MIRLEIDNSTCKITGLDTKQYAELKEVLSYRLDDKVRYFSGNFRTKNYLINRQGEFPTGLLYLVNKYLAEAGIKVKREDLRRRPNRKLQFAINLPHTPYPEQEHAAIRGSLQGRGIIVAPTGVGKSLIAALLINKLKVRTLIVVPTLELKRQLTESMQEYFGKGAVGLNNNITVENIDSASLITSNKYDCVIIDEFHHSGAKTYRKLNKKCWNKTYYKFGLTATPFRTNDNERLLLESVLSKVIFRIHYTSAVRQQYIVPVDAFYVEVPKTKHVKGYTWAEVYSELVVNNEKRNALIAEILGMLGQNKKSSLCLVKEIKHGENIQKLLGAAPPPFIKGENLNNREILENFMRGSYKVLIGTNGVVGEGVDTKPAEFVIIAGLGKARGQFMQQVGRAVRKYPGKESAKVIIFKDVSHKFTRRHFNAQVDYLAKEYGVLPTRLDIKLAI